MYPDKREAAALESATITPVWRSSFTTIERFCGSSEEIADEVRMTVLHESGHFFALTDEELEAMGLG